MFSSFFPLRMKGSEQIYRERVFNIDKFLSFHFKRDSSLFILEIKQVIVFKGKVKGIAKSFIFPFSADESCSLSL